MLQLTHEVLGLLGFSCQLAAGSTICAFTCSGCQSCGHHLDANFDFSLSITAKWTPCSKKCDSCRQAKLRVYKTEMLRIPSSRLIFFIFSMMNKNNFQFRCNKEEKSVGYLQVEGTRFSAQRSWNHVFSPSFWRQKKCGYRQSYTEGSSIEGVLDLFLLPISQLTLLSQLLGSTWTAKKSHSRWRCVCVCVCVVEAKKDANLRFALHWLLLLGWWVSRKSHGEGWVAAGDGNLLGTEAGRWMDAKVQMGCHTKETRLFVTQKVQLLSAERSCFMKDKKKISLSPTSFHTSKGPRDSHDFRGRTSYQCITTLRFCSVFFWGELVPG